MKRIIALIVLIAGFNTLHAQDKMLLSIEDVSINYSLYPRELSQCNWIPNTSNYTYVNDNELLIFNEKGTQIKSISLDDLNAHFNEDDHLSRLPNIRWHGSKTASFQKGKTIYKITLTTTIKVEKAIELPEGSNAHLEYDIKTLNYSYTNGNDLFVNGVKINASENAVVNGQSVHRNEFGINKGTFWNHNHSKLAFYKNDQSTVSDYPMLNITTRVAEANMIKYPMAGEANEVVKLGVYDIKSRQTLYLNTGTEDQYLTNITWGPNGQFIYIGVLNRGQNHLK
ncbi:MAG: DPP IV N-terminal domain-containing protein, partial [Bacteroidia bacterium]